MLQLLLHCIATARALVSLEHNWPAEALACAAMLGPAGIKPAERCLRGAGWPAGGGVPDLPCRSRKLRCSLGLAVLLHELTQQGFRSWLQLQSRLPQGLQALAISKIWC